MSAELAYLAERLDRTDEHRHPGFSSGSHSRFDRMIQRQHRRLRRMVAGMLADPSRVDDVLQEGYLRAYRRLPRRFANEAHEAAWLQKVVFRCCLEELRRVRLRREEPTDEVNRLEKPAQDGTLPSDVARALKRLSVDERSVLVLVDVLGLDYQETADRLTIARGTVASRLSGARAHFRDALVAEGVRIVIGS